MVYFVPGAPLKYRVDTDYMSIIIGAGGREYADFQNGKSCKKL